jgi:hypothetical protein
MMTNCRPSKFGMIGSVGQTLELGGKFHGGSGPCLEKVVQLRDIIPSQVG